MNKKLEASEKMIIHEDINNDIKFLAKSEIRLKILSELESGPKTIKELVKLTKITYSSVSSNLNKLETTEYVKKIKNRYQLNPLSGIYFKTLMEFKMSLDFIDNFDELWDKHNIDQINIESMRNITHLKDSILIETTPIDIYKTHNEIKMHILESNNLKAVFPYLHPEYPKLIESILKKNGDVELIIPRTIFKQTIFNIDEKIRKEAAKNGKLHVYSIKNDIQLYLTICDETMSLGLFKNDGSFDQNRILISNSDSSKYWAENLFEHVKNSVI